jgi:benzylsuccinate CoA-transferase BbsF subunit
MNKKPFEGLKVLELCWAGVGVFTLNFLSHYGAKTIRVETATHPDPVRCFEPFAVTNKPGEPVGLERSAFYSITHCAPEYDILLDLKIPEAVGVFKKLVAWADIVGEGFPAGTVDKLGLGYEELVKINPAIIMFRTCSYGHTGPMAAQPGFGSIMTAATMMDTIVGWPDRPPLAPTTYYTDMLAPLFGASAIITALDYRRRTGKGQYIDQSQMESGLNYMTPLILDFQSNNRPFSLKANKNDNASPHGIYKCKGEDRWIAIAVMTEDQWHRFVKAIGNPPWSKMKKLATVTGRLENSEELDRLVETWTMNYPPEAIQEILQSAGVGAGVVANAKDIDEDPQLNYYNFYRQLDHPYMGKLRYYHPPAFTLSESEVDVASPVLLGEHTKMICSDILGMTDEEFEKLYQKGVFK